jgi:hypothetical protein
MLPDHKDSSCGYTASWRDAALHLSKRNVSSIPPVAHSKHLAMEIERGVTVVSPNFHLVADLYRQVGVEDVDNGGLGVERWLDRKSRTKFVPCQRCQGTPRLLPVQRAAGPRPRAPHLFSATHSFDDG